MRVVHIIAPGPLAGAERVVIAGVCALRRSGADARVLVLEDARAAHHARGFIDALDDDVPVGCVHLTGRADLGAVFAVASRLQRLDPCVVHVHGYKALAITRAGAIGRRLVATHHGETGVSGAVRRYEQLARWVYRTCDAVVAVTEAQRPQLTASGVRADRVHVVANPLTRPPIDLDSRSTPPSSGRFRLAFVGRVSHEKGLDRLLDALDRLPPDLDWSLDVLGDGPDRIRLEGRCIRLRMGDRVRFHGFVSSIDDVLVQADAIVLPSRTEGLPLTAIEALTSGVPVIATRVGGLPALLDRSGAAICVPAEELSGALVRASARIGVLRAIAMREAPRWRRVFAPSTWAGATRALYEQLIDGAAPEMGADACPAPIGA